MKGVEERDVIHTVSNDTHVTDVCGLVHKGPNLVYGEVTVVHVGQNISEKKKRKKGRKKRTHTP